MDESGDQAALTRLPANAGLGGHVMGLLVGTNCSSRLRPHDSIDSAMIVPGACKPALQRCNPGAIVIAISGDVRCAVVVPIVIIGVVAIRIRVAIWIISIIWEWREEREAKCVDEDKGAMVKTVEAIAMECSRSAAHERPGTPCRHGAEVRAADTTPARGSVGQRHR